MHDPEVAGRERSLGRTPSRGSVDPPPRPSPTRGEGSLSSPPLWGRAGVGGSGWGSCLAEDRGNEGIPDRGESLFSPLPQGERESEPRPRAPSSPPGLTAGFHGGRIPLDGCATPA